MQLLPKRSQGTETKPGVIRVMYYAPCLSPYFFFMAQGKILLGLWTADIYLEDCLMIRSTGVDNEDCA